MEAEEKPIGVGLFTTDSGQTRLIASRRRSTGHVSFPAESGNPATDEFDLVQLAPRGTLFTWTSQQFLPPSPPYAGDEDHHSFEPYAVGYVEFPEGILVQGRLTESSPDRLRIGQEMKVVTIPFRRRDPSDPSAVDDYVTFAFSPADEDAQDGGAQR
ncbi:hypothetical protein Z051_15750 [Rhodococcus rhodochrous KG-21]|uniref:ChsH2 C-terminal OB-fold domain-containing protein n=2 Tax=Rhodococcus rhodochrous TaxID=1829 RepID=A0A0M8PLQ2_RHORH|nr:hypothetical protein Z051_15750 [Rhodococcus rhodochrous KG-21]